MEIWNVGNRIVNTYIYQIEDGYIMIDTGYDNGLNKVLKKMEKNNLKPENIRYIFLTDRRSTRLNSSHTSKSRMPSSA